MSTEIWKDKVIVVTGGARGIGLCLVQTFLNADSTVEFCDVNEADGRYWEEKLRAPGKEVSFTPADLGKEQDCRRFAKGVLERHPEVDLLINNAGITDFGSQFLERPYEQWEKILNSNLSSQFLLSQLFAQSLSKRGGSIINIASTRALMSEPNSEPYSASKGGIVALTHSLAITLAPLRVRVNCISPGWIEVSEWQREPETPRLRKKDHEQHPVGRVGKPEDIAHACMFLGSSESAGFITGQNLVVDGGMTRKMIYVE